MTINKRVERVDMVQRVASLALLGFVVGCVVALAAVGFVNLVTWLNDILLISPRSRMLFDNKTWLMVLTVIVPALGGLLVGLLIQYIPERRPHGPADAIQAAQVSQGSMPLKDGLLTAVTAIMSLGCGASVGQYGPLAHMGATLGSWMGSLRGNSRYLATIGIGCGAAAAIATAFNAPIAGLVFAHEVILRHYSLRAFAPITVAATTGYLAANLIFERPPLFRIDNVAISNGYEFIVFIGIGIVGALIGVLLMRLLLNITRFSQRLALPAPIKPALAGLMVGLVALQLPDILGTGKELLRFAVIDDAFGASELAMLLLAKICLTALCLGLGFSGGIFSPSLLIGILFGALIGVAAQWLLGDSRSHIAIYAVCGMVAVTSPVIGAPLTTILIVFELTRNYDLATAAMVSVAFASLFGYKLFGRSLFDAQLSARGFDLSLGRDKVIVQQRKLREFVVSSFTKVNESASLEEVRSRLVADANNEAYVVNDADEYIGTISLYTLSNPNVNEAPFNASSRSPVESLLNIKASSIAKPEVLIFHPDESIWEAMNKLKDYVGESIPIVEKGKLLGVVFEATIVRAYLDTTERIKRDENAAF